MGLNKYCEWFKNNVDFGVFVVLFSLVAFIASIIFAWEKDMVMMLLLVVAGVTLLVTEVLFIERAATEQPVGFWDILGHKIKSLGIGFHMVCLLILGLWAGTALFLGGFGIYRFIIAHPEIMGKVVGTSAILGIWVGVNALIVKSTRKPETIIKHEEERKKELERMKKEIKENKEELESPPPFKKEEKPKKKKKKPKGSRKSHGKAKTKGKKSPKSKPKGEELTL